MKRCVYCNREIDYKYLEKEKNKEEIRCPICYKELEANQMSKFVFFSLLLLVALLIFAIPIKVVLKGILSISWIILSLKYLKVRIYIYEEK